MHSSKKAMEHRVNSNNNLSYKRIFIMVDFYLNECDIGTPSEPLEYLKYSMHCST